jgi:uncharacterized damage-inducible protein DinB
MPGNPPPETSELDALLGYLNQQRDGLRYASFGLTEEQLRAKPTKSALSIGALLKHAAHTEESWARLMTGDRASGNEQAYADSFSLGPGDARHTLLAELERVAAQTEAIAQALPSVEVRVQLPDAPWYPKHPDGFSARWILLHLIEELARHAGHADIIREHIDGATMYELMAGAEGWPETPWLKPWKPPVPGE